MEQCAWEPLAYPSTVEAHEHLLPSLAIPSDHAPSLVDFRLVENTTVTGALPLDWGELLPKTRKRTMASYTVFRHNDADSDEDEEAGSEYEAVESEDEEAGSDEGEEPGSDEVRPNEPWRKNLRQAEPNGLTEQVCTSESTTRRACFCFQTFRKLVGVDSLCYECSPATRNAAHQAQGTQRRAPSCATPLL